MSCSDGHAATIEAMQETIEDLRRYRDGYRDALRECVKAHDEDPTGFRMLAAIADARGVLDMPTHEKNNGQTAGIADRG